MSSILLIRISSAHNADTVRTAADTVKRFLNRVGAWYKHHKSNKSASEYLLVERPDDKLSPEVDVRVSDHTLPVNYQQPDLDIDPDTPERAGAYSVPEAIDLLEGFFDGDYRNIIEGEPISASFRSYKNLYYPRKCFILSSIVPDAKVSDPIVQSMVDEVSSILRGVIDEYFPRIVYVNTIKQGNAYVLYYAAEGKGFKIGVVCGTDGQVHKVVFVSNGGRIKSKTHILPTPDSLRLYVDHVGSSVSKSRRK